MVKCPFCNFENEDGALFCEQCKSDLSGVEPSKSGAGEAIPVAAVLDETVPMAATIEGGKGVETVPMAQIIAEAAAAKAGAPAPRAESMPAAPGAAAAATPSAPGAEPPGPPAAAPAPPPEPYMPAAEAPPAAPAAALPVGAQPKLVVLRGQKIGVEYPIYPDLNFVGRADEKPVDIDLEDQEPPDRVWTSRQHALITFENSTLTIEDLNSANGTYVNRTRVYPGQKRQLNLNDVIQIGTVQMKVKA